MRLDKFVKKAIVSSIMHDVPKPNLVDRKKKIQDAVVKAMSPDVRRVYKSSPSALRMSRPDCEMGSGSWEDRSVIVGNVPDSTIRDIVKPFVEEDRARYEVECQLRGIVESCSTLAALKKALPEFERYFPTEAQPTKNLPALANLVTDLTKLGWPAKKAA